MLDEKMKETKEKCGRRNQFLLQKRPKLCWEDQARKNTINVIGESKQKTKKEW